MRMVIIVIITVVILGLFLITLFGGFSNTASLNPIPSPSMVTSTPNNTFSPLPTATSSATSSAVLLTSPTVNSVITSPLEIRGEAPGTWFFEGQMNARLETAAGIEIAEVPVLAEGEWMTDALVPFRGLMRFTAPPGNEPLYLVIENDNPSGLLENAKSYEIQVRVR